MIDWNLHKTWIMDKDLWIYVQLWIFYWIGFFFLYRRGDNKHEFGFAHGFFLYLIMQLLIEIHTV